VYCSRLACTLANADSLAAKMQLLMLSRSPERGIMRCRLHCVANHWVQLDALRLDVQCSAARVSDRICTAVLPARSLTG
jgi:hypothetical protein